MQKGTIKYYLARFIAVCLPTKVGAGRRTKSDKDPDEEYSQQATGKRLTVPEKGREYSGAATQETCFLDRVLLHQIYARLAQRKHRCGLTQRQQRALMYLRSYLRRYPLD